MPCWVHRANVMYVGMVVSPFVRDFRFHPEFPISTLCLRKTIRQPPSRVNRSSPWPRLGGKRGSFGSFADLFNLFLASNPRQCRSQRGLTLQPQPIFATGICHREVPREGHVVDCDNRIGEDFPPPD
jgi:hypothetical protein